MRKRVTVGRWGWHGVTFNCSELKNPWIIESWFAFEMLNSLLFAYSLIRLFAYSLIHWFTSGCFVAFALICSNRLEWCNWLSFCSQDPVLVKEWHGFLENNVLKNIDVDLWLILINVRLREYIFFVVGFLGDYFVSIFDEFVDDVFASALMVLSRCQGLLRSCKSVVCFGVV